jgi:hypothetical protein
LFYARLVDGPLVVERPEQAPDTVSEITLLIGRLLLTIKDSCTATHLDEALIYHN